MEKKLVGRIKVAVSGGELNSLPGAKLKYGGVERTEIVTDQGIFFSETLTAAMVECEIVSDSKTDLSKISGWDNVTLTFTPDVGKAYVIANAWLENSPEMTGGDGGKVPLTFKGSKAEAVGGN